MGGSTTIHAFVTLVIVEWSHDWYPVTQVDYCTSWCHVSEANGGVKFCVDVVQHDWSYEDDAIFIYLGEFWNCPWTMSIYTRWSKQFLSFLHSLFTSFSLCFVSFLFFSVNSPMVHLNFFYWSCFQRREHIYKKFVWSSYWSFFRCKIIFH